MPTPAAAAANPSTVSFAEASAAFEQGMAMANGDSPAKVRERADVKRWQNLLLQTENYDQASRKTYVKCRRYARGDSGFLVDANIVGVNVDILEAFLYAKDPDVDIDPAKSVEAPSLDAMLDTALEYAQKDPRLAQMQQDAANEATFAQANAAAMGPQVGPDGLPMPPPPSPQEATAGVLKMLADEYLAKIKATYDRRTRENKAYAETGQVVVSRVWKDGRMKSRGRPYVRSALTVGVGIFKGSWQNRTAPSPQTQVAINDLQQQIDRAKQLRYQIEDDQEGDVQDANIAELERQLVAIQEKKEQVVARGYVIDNVAPENFLCAPGYRLADHCDAPWNAERIPMAFDKICALGKLTPEQKAQIVKYTARRPEMIQAESANLQLWDAIDVTDASQFIKGDGGASMAGDAGYQAAAGIVDGQGGGCFGMVWEIWDRDSNSVLWLVEGLDVWLKPAWQPPATTRFYPYFLYCTSEVDGQRHPQSPVERSWKLVDEYNRIGTAEAKHRRRILPKTGFNAGAFDAGEAKKLEKADIGEMVALKLTNPKQDIRSVMLPITYAAIDVALYDRTRIIQEIERIWGVQEALGGSINTEKTATEAEIQDKGFNARTGSRRDALESVLGEHALFTLEVCRANMTYEEVVRIAGPNAFWPPYQGAADVLLALNVEIRAGTTGKPNTRADREAWGVVLPQLQTAITQYAQLTGANPLDVAESVKKLATITAQRAGERIDIDALFPKPGAGPVMAPVGPDGSPAKPGAEKPPGGPPNPGAEASSPPAAMPA